MVDNFYANLCSNFVTGNFSFDNFYYDVIMTKIDDYKDRNKWTWYMTEDILNEDSDIIQTLYNKSKDSLTDGIVVFDSQKYTLGIFCGSKINIEKINTRYGTNFLLNNKIEYPFIAFCDDKTGKSIVFSTFPPIYYDWSKLHYKIMQEVIDFFNEHRDDIHDVYRVSFDVDELQCSIDNKEWCPGSDSSLSAWERGQECPFVYSM